jgi:hypothetical protein
MTNTNRRQWATAAVCLLVLVAALAVLAASTQPAIEPVQSTAGEAGSASTVGLTVMPPPAAEPQPTSQATPEFTAAELRYLQLLHDQTEFEAEYAPDASMVVIGVGMCARRDRGETVPQMIDYLYRRGYTSLAAGWIVGSALQELCVPAGER